MGVWLCPTPPHLTLSPQGTFLPASSEEEIFQHLGLDYIPPTLRNA